MSSGMTKPTPTLEVTTYAPPFIRSDRRTGTMKFFVLLCVVTKVYGESNDTKDEGTPWLPFFGINSFPSFSLHLPQLPPEEKIKVTKTQYIEVTRRQTIHPMCYTVYENKSPCLPHRSYEEEEPEMDLDTSHQTSEDMTEYMKPVAGVLEDERDGKFLRFRGGEPIRRSTEYVTTTVLLTKLEKYTDHRVTATMVAQNCLPVDVMMPRCRRQVINPIIEVPIRGKDGDVVIDPNAASEQVKKTVEAVKKAAKSVMDELTVN